MAFCPLTLLLLLLLLNFFFFFFVGPENHLGGSESPSQKYVHTYIYKLTSSSPTEIDSLLE